jgi:hypothetical protein
MNAHRRQGYGGHADAMDKKFHRRGRGGRREEAVTGGPMQWIKTGRVFDRIYGMNGIRENPASCPPVKATAADSAEAATSPKTAVSSAVKPVIHHEGHEAHEGGCVK